MKDKYPVTLPFFPGFYESMLSHAIDDAEERDAEYYAEKESSEKYHPETYQPEHLRLSESEYASIFFDCTDYQATYHGIAKMWVEAFDCWMKEHIGTPEKSFTFEKMLSPREYNFTTDRVFAEVPYEVIDTLFSKSASGDHKTLKQVIKDTFTSYDGFISHYSNSLAEWLTRPLNEWDYNEMGTLVAAVIKASEHWEDTSEFSMHLYGSVFSGNGEDEREVDWPKFEAKVAALRAEKQEAYEAAEAVTK